MRSISNLELSDECIKDDENVSAIVRHVPLGVVVGIVPWNFPIWLACAKIAPALITGNTIIIKPSPFTPYCVLKMAELAQRFFPPGVVQALSGDDLLGEWLTTHPNPAKIHFTGSTVTGRKVMESASKTLKRVTLEWYVISSADLFQSQKKTKLTPKKWWKRCRHCLPRRRYREDCSKNSNPRIS
jgi:acyl-CoA reductase-like NAD-dependent aldehyde dehydrogenase